ncbi:MAG: hypothetical protein GY716_01080 [bacterium]|nr:hypothetical protein [bacterium]
MSEQHETYTVSPDESDPKAASTAIVGIVGIIGVTVIVLLLQALFYRTNDAEERRKLIEGAPSVLLEQRDEQARSLEQYGWVDRDAQVVSIPIERAMQLVVEEQAGAGN